MNVNQNKAAGYEYLLTYKLATVVYDLTVQFCNRWINSHSRIHDQMIQAARSGKQNIPEGYKQESLKGYIKLTGVARGSQEELLKDFEDYARQNGIAVWPKEKARGMREIREIWRELREDCPYRPSRPFLLPKDKERAINLMLTLINQTNYMLDRQIESLEKKFIEEGGFTENLLRRRLRRRKEKQRSQRKSANKIRRESCLVLLAVILLGLVGCSSVRAAGARQAGVQVSPLSIEREVHPGEEFFFAVKFFNPLNYTQHIRPKFKDFVVFKNFLLDQEEEVRFLDYSSPRYTVSRWADFEKEIIALGPGEERSVKVVIRVPKDAVPGGHFGAFFGEVRVGADSAPTGQGSNPEGEVPSYQVKQRVAAGTLVFLSVLGENSGDDDWAGGVSDFSIEGKRIGGLYLASKPLHLRTVFVNKGLFHQNVWGGLSVRDAVLGAEVGAFRLQEKKALPEAYVAYSYPWRPSLPLGKYEAKLKLLYGRNGERVAERTLKFWVVNPLFLAVAVGLGLVLGAFAAARRRRRNV